MTDNVFYPDFRGGLPSAVDPRNAAGPEDAPPPNSSGSAQLSTRRVTGDRPVADLAGQRSERCRIVPVPVEPADSSEGPSMSELRRAVARARVEGDSQRAEMLSMVIESRVRRAQRAADEFLDGGDEAA